MPLSQSLPLLRLDPLDLVVALARDTELDLARIAQARADADLLAERVYRSRAALSSGAAFAICGGLCH